MTAVAETLQDAFSEVALSSGATFPNGSSRSGCAVSAPNGTVEEDPTADNRVSVSAQSEASNVRRNLSQRLFSTMTIGGVRHSMLTLTSTALGGGMLSVAYMMNKSGVLMGSLMLLVGASLSFMSTAALMQMTALTGKDTYAALLSYCVGPRAGPVLDALLFVFGCGSMVGYFVFLGDFLPSLVHLAAPSTVNHHDTVRSCAIIGSALLLVPLVLQRDLAALRHVAPVSIISLCYMTTVVAFKAPALYAQNEGNADFGSIKLGVFNYELCEAFALCVFAFNCHLNVVPVAGKLLRPTKARITKVSATVNLLQVCFYLLIGMAGYFSFLNKTPQDLIVGYDSGDPLVAGGRVMLSCTMLVAIPINQLPTVRSALQIGDYFNGNRHLQSVTGGQSLLDQSVASEPQDKHREVLRVVLTLSALTCQAALAIAVPGVADVLGLLGGTVATAMMLTIPAYTMGVVKPPTRFRQAQQALLYIFSAVSVASVPVKILRYAGVLPH